MTLTGERPCAFPPHPESAEPETIVVTESALSRFRGWLRHAPAERLPLPAVPVLWTAAEIMHQVGVSGMYPGAATVAAVLGGGWLGDRNARDPGRAAPRSPPPPAPWARGLPARPSGGRWRARIT